MEVMTYAILTLFAIASFSLPLPAKAQSATSSALTLTHLLGTSTPVESSKPIHEWLASSSPRAGSTVAPILGTIDAGRTSVAAFLQNQIRYAAAKLPGNEMFQPGGDKKSVNTTTLDWHRILQSVIGMLWTTYFFLLVIVRFAVAKLAFFYILFVAVIGLVLYKLFRRVRG
jgi:hypothetical protein